jgi:hypothetical protein
MDLQRLIVSTALAAVLIAGGGSVAAGANDSVSASCVGAQVSMMAQMHGGMAAATDHHNEMHGTDLTVGQHQAHIRDEMCGR